VADQARPEVGSNGLQVLRIGHAQLVQHRPLIHPARTAGGEVIDDRDFVTAAEQGIGQVRSDEAGAAGDEYAHGCAVYAGKPDGPGPARRPHHHTSGPAGPAHAGQFARLYAFCRCWLVAG
jgi:hypothetical protein